MLVDLKSDTVNKYIHYMKNENSGTISLVTFIKQEYHVE